MIEDILSLSAIAVISSLLSILLKKERADFSVLISIAAGACLIIYILPSLYQTIKIISDVSERSGINSQYISIIIKSCVISTITTVCAATCRDCGQSSLAMGLELAGRIAIILSALPVINSLLSLILSMIK